MNTGKDLCEDLARSLQGAGWMAWANQPLGSVQLNNVPIADVVAVPRSFTGLLVRIYEVKISRDDFWQDVNKGKFTRYLPHCNQLFFAVPAGMIQKNELPEGCGLVTFGPKGWHTQVAAPRHHFTPSLDLMLALLMKGYQDHFERYRKVETERLKDYASLSEVCYLFGSRLAKDIAVAADQVNEAQRLKARIEEAAGKKFPDIGWALDWLRRDVEDLLASRRYTPEAAEALSVALDLLRGIAYDAAKDLRALAERVETKRVPSGKQGVVE